MKSLASLFKHEYEAGRIVNMHPQTILILMDMLLFINANGEKAEVTSTVRTLEENKREGAVSLTHVEGRAFDLHCKTWSPHFKAKFEAYFSDKYKGKGAVTKKGEEKLIVCHGEGSSFHCHVQLSPIFSIGDIYG